MANKKYDVIVIGSGPGGLSCAALLAKWGLKTLLLEKNDLLGGKAVTPTKDGFTCDQAPKLQVPPQGPSFATVFKELGIESQLKPIPLETAGEAYRGPSGKYKKTVLPTSTGLSPDPFFELWDLDQSKRDVALNFMVNMAMMPADQVAALDDLSSAEWLSRFKDIPQQLVSYMEMHANASLAEPIDLVAASEQVAIMQDVALRGAAGYYVGGFGRVLGDMANALKALGGEIRTKAAVQKIKVSNGRVTGVATHDETFDAPIVVSDAGIQPTVLKLVGEDYFDPSYLSWVKGLIPGWAFTGVRYHLSKKVLEYQMYLIYADDTIINLERYNKMRSGNVPDEVLMFATVPSNFDPNMAPPGKQCIVAGTICSPDPSAKEVKMLLKKMDEMWDKLYPGVMDAVIFKEIEGPKEISQFTRDSVMKGQGGECVGLGQIVGQCGKYQPSPKAPINGLFYTGADVGIPGMGTHKASGGGIKTARMVMQYKRMREAMI